MTTWVKQVLVKEDLPRFVRKIFIKTKDVDQGLFTTNLKKITRGSQNKPSLK